MSAEKNTPYPGGIAAILTQMEGRREALELAPGEALPPYDTPLVDLAAQLVPDPDADPAEAPPFRSAHHRKRHALRRELTGRSELVFLNALLIAHLRKRGYPAHAPALFQRLWTEEGTALLAQLDPRWLVSSVTTFGDHGLSLVQRSVGLALSTLFGTMKLYESERLYSGCAADRPFALGQRDRGPLPLEMDGYSLSGGGLDVNMIGRLWLEAEGDPVIRPLAHRLLELLIADERTVFQRLMTMRKRQARQGTARAKGDAAGNVAPVPARHRGLTAQTLRWGITATIRAPLPEIARFAAHHVELGAEVVQIHLDAPDPETEAFLSHHPALRVTQCDDGYWQAQGRARPEAHQVRQAFNATQSLRDGLGVDWLGHIDVDEFLLPQRPMADLLAEVPPGAAFARVAPAEALAPDSGLPQAFKTTHKHAGQPKSVIQELYPTFGAHLYGGFLSHTSGKVFARTGIDGTRLGLHTLKYRGEVASNRHRLGEVWLAHLHARSWQQFRADLAFRRSLGSYRKNSERPEMGQAELISFLMEEEGDAGLRALFDEVCADTPARRAGLAAHGMLIEHPFDPDAAVTRVFGALP
ncbi:glycosyltransferase family 2 protein [Salipiger mangrovisoli]|uniref:Glycosyltransferase family 2 protein n=1 Tax=Salipiger mangrovisoli TaxID=2865933 RepID=A0ABR9X067_9RHOB|nr:glycosyltransferase family 2 protein [Salipiger mangrovisoli]MBE9636929.1 glycosyltransferase family 2 protein [Salipiger mangrovisoli]